MSQIASLIRSLAGRSSSVLKVCEVTSLDRGARTIDCQPLDETAPILGASLQADSGGTQGLTLYPKVGSLVIVGLVEGTPLGVVLLADELNTLKQVLTSWTPVPQDGGASLKASVASWAGRQLQLTRQSDYEDTKVKH